MKHLAATFCLLGALCLPAAAAERPNILWITAEDISPNLGCYGDPFARTPHLDAFARQAVRYARAFATAPVCAPARACLITGVYATSLGNPHLRCEMPIPADVKGYPAYLRQAGYFTANNAKTDYNLKDEPGFIQATWDRSDPKAHWRQRRPGQPFFAVFNLMETHQSRSSVWPWGQFEKDIGGRLKPAERADPAKVRLPPFYPDTPLARRTLARYYDCVQAMDREVGRILGELDEAGLAEDTIVFFYSDHGMGLPRGKRCLYDSGMHVPLLIRFPKKWRHLAPAEPGQTTDRFVSFVDLPPTLLILAGVKVPGHLQGVAFLGPAAGRPREFVFGARDRVDEVYDTARSVRDSRWLYIRNYRPHLSWAQHISYVHQHASMRAWQALNEKGKLGGPAVRFFQTKPPEELYDVQADPWEVTNLAADPRYRKELERLRAECLASMKGAGDLGLLPEREVHARAAGRTPYDIATDPRHNPLDDLLAAANLANQRDPRHLPRLVELLGAKDSAVRWWGAVGLVALRDKAKPAAEALRRAARDDSPDVRLAAAEALAHLGHEEALPVIREGLRHDSVFIRLAALNVADRLGARARPLLPAVRAAKVADAAHKDVAEYVGRMVDYLPDRIERAAAAGKNP